LGLILQKMITGRETIYDRAALSAEEGKAALGGSDGSLVVLNLKTGVMIYRILPGQSKIMSLEILPGGAVLAGYQNGEIIEFTNQGEIAKKITPHKRAVTSLSTLPGGRFVSGSADRTAKIWDLDGKLIKEFRPDLDDIYCLLYHNGKLLAGRGDGSILDCTYPEKKKVIVKPGGEPVNELASNGTEIAAALSSGEVLLISGETWEAKKIARFKLDASCVSFSPDGDLLAAGGEEGKILFYYLSSGKKIEFHAHPNTVTRLDFSPDGRLLCTSSCDNTVRIWDATNQNLLKTLRGHDDEVWDVCFIDNKRAASASSDKTVRIWDVTSGRCLKVLKGHEDAVSGLAVSPDGKYLVSVSWDGTAGIWDKDNWKLERKLSAGEELLYVTFLPGGAIAAGGVKDSVFTWEKGH